MEAIGASRYSNIKTVVESGELSGNLTNFWQGSRSPTQAQNQQRGAFESYFESPNLRFNSLVTEKNQVIALHGCDGKVSWYIDSVLKRSELRPKAANEGECEEGFKEPLSRLQEPNVKIRLVKKKEIEGRMAWEIRVDDPKTFGTGNYYFDAETFLLLRLEKQGTSISYSDYRDVGGIRLPFTIVQELTNSKLVTTLREVKINAPIEAARFVEPQIIHGQVVWNTTPPRKDGADAVNSATAPPANPAASTISPPPEAGKIAAPESAVSHDAPTAAEVNFPNYTSCQLPELEAAVPELKGLKLSNDQQKLAGVLDKVGAKTLDIAQNTPNLIARERVTAPEGAGAFRRDYDYLILARPEGKMITLDEFRLDLKTGEKFQTDEIIKEPLHRSDLERASNEANSKAEGPPMSQGFATSWVHFYPSNRVRATYRYLGEEKMDGHRVLVLAFAQKPASVSLPALFRYQSKTAPLFLQGVAWVDPSDFRILRLRTDLLAPVPEVSLHRWTADIQFGATRIEQVPVPLQLPRKVSVTTVVGGEIIREVHEYSDYRLFRAQSRVVLLP